ncbi:MAG: hypothetical protein HKP58_01335, partial [Desulfatitalea sp.]|nr:hypothetical protein [Desulfatitalea sp.]NNJ99029.1 hypothetical protein [Desulfatitalea sp.]
MRSSFLVKPLRGRKLWVWFAAIYLALLLVSHGIRRLQPDPWPAPPRLHSLTLSAAPGNGGPADIRYVDTRPGAVPDEPVVLLIHGSPAPASMVFD